MFVANRCHVFADMGVDRQDESGFWEVAAG
jgi:hypothetical protein